MMDHKALAISITLGFFIFLAVGICCIFVTTASLSYWWYGMDSRGLSLALESTIILIKDSKMILTGFYWGLLCTAIVHLMREPLSMRLFKVHRVIHDIFLSGMAWFLCSIVAWFTPHILFFSPILVSYFIFLLSTVGIQL